MHRILIYKGELRSQFSTEKLKDIGTGKFQYASYRLEPRFRLFNASKVLDLEIEKYENIEALFELPKSDLKHKQNGVVEIELYENQEPRNGKRVLVNEIHFYVDLEKTLILNELWPQKINWHSLEERDQHPDLNFKTFLSSIDKIKAGKIVGEAYVILMESAEKVIEHQIKDSVLIQTNSKETPTEIEQAKRRGCLSLFLPFIPLKNSRLGKYLYLNKLSTDSTLPSGCLPLFFPGGHWGFNLFRRLFPSFGLPSTGVPGCGSSGCGCMSLLFLLAIPFLLFKTCNRQNENTSNQPELKVIHDTIVKEVIKEKVDTLFITKTDTVSYVDSTTVTTVEMVKLPNVQFYTDADVLLPSSAKELQKLAQYLTDNPNLKATIIGHTDNTGDPQANLSLSKRRAESVLNFLTQLGVKKNRLTSIGMGDRNPIGDNEKEEGRLMNRRVEVRLTEIGKIETKRSNKE